MSLLAPVLTSPTQELANRLGVDDLDFICYLDATQDAGALLVPPRRLESYEALDMHIDLVTNALALRGLGDDVPYRFGAALQEVASNGIRHPLKCGLPYRPLSAVRITDAFVWATVTEENPGFDPRTVDWQFVADSAKLFEPNGRSAMFVRFYADFSSWVRFNGHPWTNYLAIRLPDAR